MQNWKLNAFYVLGGLLMGGACVFGWQHLVPDSSNQAELLAKLRDYESREQEAIITKRVSQQMEEIAYQQKEISDYERQETEEQFQVAQQMRHRAEEGERAAREAQLGAIRSANLADSMRQLAVGQMVLAEDRLNQVILTQHKNDTLSYRVLANTLAKKSLDQNNVGNQELANMLAYSAYSFSERYHAESSDVIKALVINGPAFQTLSGHKGSVRALTMVPNTSLHERVSVSSYGEVILWQQIGSKPFEAKVLFSDSKYDFRDVYVSNQGTVYALGFNGFLWEGTLKGQSSTFIPLSGKKYVKITPFDENRILLASSQLLSWFSLKENKITFDCILPLPLSDLCVKDDLVYLFYQNGECQTVNAMGQFHTIPLPIKGKVTRALYAKQFDCFIVGMQDGSIHLINSKGQLLNSLVGHSSAITALNMVGESLISASYDRTFRYWFMDKHNINSSILSVYLDTKSWPMSVYTHAETSMVWVGLENGNIQPYSFSTQRNLTYIKNQLKRDYTQEEWDNYMGPTVPYEKIK